MTCFECTTDLSQRKSFNVGQQYFCWPCVFTILHVRIKERMDREAHMDKKAEELANDLGYLPFEWTCLDCGSINKPQINQPPVCLKCGLHYDDNFPPAISKEITPTEIGQAVDKIEKFSKELKEKGR